MKGGPMKRAALYLRVSTDGQTTANQKHELELVAKRNGWKIVATYNDQGVSGGRDNRPELDKMRKAIIRKEFDVVMAWSVDRLGRSLQMLLGFLEELKAKHVDLYLHQQGLDTSTPAGKALFQMLGVFAEFERAIIRERIFSGLRRARSQGTRSGKPIGRPRVKLDVEKKIKDKLSRDQGITSIARELGVGIGTIMRVKRQEQGKEGSSGKTNEGSAAGSERR
jgi:DNA invertase Pin-like site-specific DNA recombinase